MQAIEAIRKRPGMYIGDTADGSGLHNMVIELACNALAEVVEGHCDSIDVVLNDDGSATVRDNGRGIPVDLDPRSGRPVLELIFTELHAGARFSRSPLPATLYGVGAVVVNALSENFHARAWRDGFEHVMRFERGRAEAPLSSAKLAVGTPGRGTEIIFKPDATVFKDTTFDFAVLSERLGSLAIPARGATIMLADGRAGANAEVVFKA